MRMLIFVPLLLAGACNVDVDTSNESVELGYDQNLAENTVGTVANKAEEIGGQIVNDVEETASAVDNRVDIQVDADADAGGNEAVNTQ